MKTRLLVLSLVVLGFCLGLRAEMAQYLLYGFDAQITSVQSTGQLDIDAQITSVQSTGQLDIMEGDLVSGYLSIDPLGAAGCSADPEYGDLYCLYDSAPGFEYWFTISRPQSGASRTWLSQETLSESGFWLSDRLYSDGTCNPLVIADERFCEDVFQVFSFDLDQIAGEPIAPEELTCYGSGVNLRDTENGWLVDDFDIHLTELSSLSGVEASFSLKCVNFSTFDGYWIQADLQRLELASAMDLSSGLIELIPKLDLGPGIATSLLAHLKPPQLEAESSVISSLQTANVPSTTGCPTRHQIVAFIRQVDALAGKKISNDTARLLVTMATAILERIDC